MMFRATLRKEGLMEEMRREAAFAQGITIGGVLLMGLGAWASVVKAGIGH